MASSIRRARPGVSARRVLQRPAAFAWALALALLGGCAAKEKGAEVAPRRAPQVRVEPVVRVDVDLTRSYLVTLLPGEQAAVMSRASGYVLSWSVDRGDVVTRGQRLATIEPGDLNDQQNQAAARQAAAQAALEQARQNAARARRLMAENYVAQAEADTAATAERLATAEVAAARAALEATRTHLAFTDVVAPFDGVVLQRAAEVGALVGPSGPALFIIGTVARVRAIAAVPQPDVPHLVVGAPVTLTVEGLAEPRQGTIARFAPVLATATRTMDVELTFDNPDGALKPGMFGRAALAIDHLSGALLAPPRAMTRRGSAALAYVVRDGKAVQVTLALGRTLPDGRAEVLSGLAEGDALIVAGRELVSDGAEVRAVGPGGTAGPAKDVKAAGGAE